MRGRFTAVAAAALATLILGGCASTSSEAIVSASQEAPVPVPTSNPASDHASGVWHSAANSTSGTVDVIIDAQGLLTLQLRDFATDAAPTFGGIYAALIIDGIEDGSTCYSPNLALASPEIQATGDQDVAIGPVDDLPPVAALDSYITAAIYTVPELPEDREPGCDAYILAGYAPLEWTP